MSRISLVLLSALFAVRLMAAAEGEVVKVLPHLLDKAGRHSLSPSLFERDAYQAELRKHPERVGGIRYDIHWKVRGAAATKLRLRLQLRTSERAGVAPIVLETPVPAKSGGWTALSLDAEAYRKAGNVQAWRATLLDGDTEIAEQRSFLW